jgi:hypothetical protein
VKNNKENGTKFKAKQQTNKYNKYRFQ